MARRSNQSILKKINPEYSLEGLMLKLELQYFGYMVQRACSLEDTLMLGKTEGRRRRGGQRMRWLEGIISSMDMSLRKLRDGEDQGSLVCCSPWGHKESDTTERLSTSSTGLIVSILLWILFKKNFKLEDSCFTTLCWLLLYNSVNQSLVYKYPLPQLWILYLYPVTHNSRSHLAHLYSSMQSSSFSSNPHSLDVPEHKSTDNVYCRFDCESRQRRERQRGYQRVSPLTCRWLKQYYSISLC